MALQFSAEAARQLEELLVSRFHLALPMTYRTEERGKASRKTHVVATDAEGVRVGLKYVSAHFSDPATKKNLLPTENIVAAARLSDILETPSRIDAVMMGPIDGLGPLDGYGFAARRWHGEPLSEADKARLDQIRPRLMEQAGEWVAFGLLFALADGKPEHWTWDDATQTIGRCDLELLFFENGKVGDYRSLLTATGAEAALKAGSGADYEAFSRGLRNMVNKFHDRREQVDLVLEAIDDHTRNFLAGHAWAKRTPDEFLSALASEL